MPIKAKKQLIQEGRDWYDDRYTAVEVERNRYFVAWLASTFALILALLALVLLIPLKKLVPYVIEVDKTTGIVTVVKTTDIVALRTQQSVTTYFLTKYLNARMSYDWGLRKINAEVVRALSSAPVYQGYVATMDVHNPDSPIKLYGDNDLITVRVINCTYPYPNMAEIHFYTEHVKKLSPTLTPERQYWVVLIKYLYANDALSLNTRETINPLGFFVTDFQLNQDIKKT